MATRRGIKPAPRVPMIGQKPPYFDLVLQARLYEMSLMDFSACSSTGPQCTRR